MMSSAEISLSRRVSAAEDRVPPIEAAHHHLASHSSSDSIVPQPRRIQESRVASNGSILSASAWSLVGYGSGQFVRLMNNMVLSYLLAPEAFGTMAIVNLVIAGLGMFSEVGAGPCIIQNKNGDDPEFLNTAWTISIVRGFLIATVAAALSFPLATFYEAPSLSFLLPIAALTAIIDGFCSPGIYILQRQLNLKKLVWLELASQIIGAIGMCAMAVAFPNTIALVLGAIATSLSKTLFSFQILPVHRHSIRFSREHAATLMHFGKWIFVSTLLAFCAMQVDRMIMGKLFDLSVLGIYGFALAIATLPRLLIEKLAMSVLFPILSEKARISTEAFGTEMIILRPLVLQVGAAMLISVMLWCEPFFVYLYDPRVHEAGQLCRLLCPSMWIAILSFTFSRALVALGDTRSLALFNVCRLVFTVIFSIAGYKIAGLTGFIAGLTLGALAGHVSISASLWQHGFSALVDDFKFTFFVAIIAFVGYLKPTANESSHVWYFLLLVGLTFGVWAPAYLRLRQYRQSSNYALAS